VSEKSIPRTEPPKCRYNNVYPETRHPDGMSSRNCPVCVEHNRWVRALRYDRIMAGTYTPVPRTNRGAKRNVELRQPVPKCGRRHASVAEKRACERCKRRARYTEALRRDERDSGSPLGGLIDNTEVVQHVTKRLMPSGLTLERIGQRSGVDKHVISRAIAGRHSKIQAVHAIAILSVKPLEYATHGKGDMVNATATRRILRGLYAQGWTTTFMAELLGMTLSNLWHQVAGKPRTGKKCSSVSPQFADAVKRLREKLGAYDIAQLDTPLDGMSQLCADRAAKRGWHTLDAWEGLNIEDPRVQPHGHDALAETLDGYVLVEPQKIELALDPTDVRAGRRFGVLFTHFELYQFIAGGSQPDAKGNLRYSADALSARAGIADRTVQRIRAELTAVRDLVATGVDLPTAATAAELVLLAAELDPVLRLEVARRLLAPFPIATRRFYRHLVVLSLIHPEPYGLGWTDEQLAAWLGTSTDDAAALRHAAVLAGRQYYEPRGSGAGGGRTRRVGTELPATTGEEQRCAA
jgi:hypothetical protein